MTNGKQPGERATIAVWACAGADASPLAYRVAGSLAEAGKTLIAELPCLGIPRLGFAAGIMDREKNTEAALTQYEQRNMVPWEMAHQVSARLAVLPASVFAVPDCPITAKVSVKTLAGFAEALRELAWREGCRYLLLDCQGQLTSAMTFFALKTADQVVIPINQPTEAAYVIAAVRRLVNVYHHRADKFILASAGDSKAIKKVAAAGAEGDEGIGEIRVAPPDAKKLAQMLGQASPAPPATAAVGPERSEMKRDKAAKKGSGVAQDKVMKRGSEAERDEAVKCGAAQDKSAKKRGEGNEILAKETGKGWLARLSGTRAAGELRESPQAKADGIAWAALLNEEAASYGEKAATGMATAGLAATGMAAAGLTAAAVGGEESEALIYL
ncbi:MAG: hypothetical protein LBK98_08485 [Peptococcaceae bacterium]|jgi:MinD-like ATPase involved in chromosome partitioning or flagellar assembly|nr:hypothetical protein [Peptococcaceae bacterium]